MQCIARVAMCRCRGTLPLSQSPSLVAPELGPCFWLIFQVIEGSLVHLPIFGPDKGAVSGPCHCFGACYQKKGGVT